MCLVVIINDEDPTFEILLLFLTIELWLLNLAFVLTQQIWVKSSEDIFQISYYFLDKIVF